jgi:hypothetical protein
MREFIKGVCCLAVLIGLIMAIFAWSEERPAPWLLSLRLVAPLVAMGGFGLFLLLHFQRDRVPDFLRRKFRGSFERGGLCFNFNGTVENGAFCVRVHFQNRYDHPCRGQIALRPQKGMLWSNRDSMPLCFDFDCPAAGYGIVTLPVAVPRVNAGKPQTFEVGATVVYPHGRGRMVRYQPGNEVRHNACFRNPFGNFLSVFGLLAGMVVLYRPATVTFTPPPGIDEFPQLGAAPHVHIFWCIDDARTTVGIVDQTVP